MNLNNINRREFLNTSAILTTGSAFIPSFFIGKSKPKLSETIIGHGDFKYRIHKKWGTLDAAKTPVLNCHEMVMDSKGRLIMIGDEMKNNVLIYDKSGKLLDAWGTSYIGGHGLTLSKEGEEDFLFIADCGFYLGPNGNWLRQAGQIQKTTLEGRLVFNIGHPTTIGVYKPDELFQPTEIAVAPNGDFYVADGYGAQYIIQYSHRGEYIRHFGGKNNEDPNYNLSTAHGVCVDTRDSVNPVLIVTSRGDNQFKKFTMEGKFIENIEMPGAYVCRGVLNEHNIYAGVCWSKIDGATASNTGFVTILDRDNKVISNPGGTKPVYENGKLQTMRNEGDHFYHCHDVCIDEDKNIYVCQWNAEKTYPVKLERI